MPYDGDGVGKAKSASATGAIQDIAASMIEARSNRLRQPRFHCGTSSIRTGLTGARCLRDRGDTEAQHENAEQDIRS
jgi:hypothetical protein